MLTRLSVFPSNQLRFHALYTSTPGSVGNQHLSILFMSPRPGVSFFCSLQASFVQPLVGTLECRLVYPLCKNVLRYVENFNDHAPRQL